jgi:hypothetical protein
MAMKKIKKSKHPKKCFVIKGDYSALFIYKNKREALENVENGQWVYEALLKPLGRGCWTIK